MAGIIRTCSACLKLLNLPIHHQEFPYWAFIAGSQIEKIHYLGGPILQETGNLMNWQ
jgi:hypothetical protein